MTARADPTEPRRLRAPIDGGEMALLRFGREGAPPMLFAHANGFCASAYRKMLESLGPRFDIFAVDLRGHGRTKLPADPGCHSSGGIFGDDVGRLINRLDERLAAGTRWTLAGHSLGAVAVTLAAAGRGDIAALRLIEPVAMASLWYAAARSPVWRMIAPRLPLVRSAVSRRAAWPSRAEVMASYGRKPFFSTWAPGVLADYLEDGLRDAGDGVALACAPAWEAATFAAQKHDFWGAVRKVRAPIEVLAAGHDSSTVSASARRRFPALGARLTVTDKGTHLLPFEHPADAADFLAGG